MTCVEKRHLGHRMGSMLHHRFPNGFTELLMDETDREVSTLTDRAFRSLCVGDDAVYNDEFSCGFSPFNCHKPLVGEPRKKAKESKRPGQTQHHGNTAGKDAQPWKQQQQQQSMTQVSSFLKALGATERSCEGIFQNGDVKDSLNGESWDRSALRSIQKELSEFSADYHNTLADGHFGRSDRHRHPSGDGSAKKTAKDASKVKNGKSAGKLKKLNIKNFFLHSEFSPFQMWRDINQFPFGREEIVASIPSDKIPKWYDSLLYKELAEAHRIDILNTEDSQPCPKAAAKEPCPSAEGVEPCQRAVVKPPPPPASKPPPPPPPPKVPPKPTVALAEKRCSSDGTDAAPWRQNKSRSRNALAVNPPCSPPQGRSSKTTEESVVQVKQEAKYVEVKAIEEVSSLASTPFSICQLMTPLIPSRQPTETSEILQLCLDLPLRPDSEAKLTPELPVKRESYKSLASSILFNLKDNRKRVKSRYSPPKFRNTEMSDRGTQSPRMDNSSHTNIGSDGYASGFSTPAILKEGRPCCSPVSKQANTPCVVPGKHDVCSSDDYLITNLLHTKRESMGSRSLGEENHLDPAMQMKNNKSPMAIKQNYPSLNLYKKAISADNGTGQLQVPLSAQSVSPDNRHQPLEQRKEPLPDTSNIQTLPKGEAVNAAPSPNIVQRLSPKVAAGGKVTSPRIQEKEGLANKPNQPGNTSRSEAQSKDFAQFIAVNDKDTSSQPLSTIDVIKAARDAINAEKHKALSASQSGRIKNIVSEPQKLTKRNTDNSKEAVIEESISVIDLNHRRHQNETDGSDDIVSKNNNVKREPPPVPKRNFTKSDIIPTLDKLLNVPSPTDGYPAEVDLCNAEKDSPPTNVSEPVRKDGRLKHIFSARQNSYIKSQRYAETEKEQEEAWNEGKTKVRVSLGKKEGMQKDGEHIINDLQALKELERARRGDVALEKAKDKLGAINIDEEAKAKNDLISRELRNIKKGMLSMRGNTQAKRDMFTKKEQELKRRDSYTKIDNNVIVNKALINDNYDRAKMALEEVISERQKHKSTREQDTDPLLVENIGTERGFVPKPSQREKVSQDSMADAQENQSGRMLALRDKELRERLGDLRDHNHMKHILSQTETKIPLPGVNTVTSDLNTRLANNSKHGNAGTEKQIDNSHLYSLELKNNINIVRQKTSEEDVGHLLKENKENLKKTDVPPVPPRSKKGVIRKDDKESESALDQTEDEFSIKDSRKDKAPSIKEVTTNSDILTDKLVTNTEKTTPISEGDPILPECITSSELQTKNKCISPREERRKEMKAYSKESPCSLGSPEQRKVKRKAPLRPDDLNTAEHVNQESTVIPENTITTNVTAAEADQTTNAEITPDQEASIDMPRNIVSPLLLVNGYNVNQSPPDQASLSSKSSYFSVESALHRNTEVYHSLDNLTAELEENEGEAMNVLGNLNNDSATAGTERVSVCDRETDFCKPPPLKSHIENEEPDREVSRLGGGGGGGDGGIDTLVNQQTTNSTPMSPASTLSSPSLEFPALFVVKDNTFSNKPIKPVHFWLPKEHLNGSESGAHAKKNLSLSKNITSSNSSHNSTSFSPDEVSSQNSPLNSLSPSSVSNDNLNLRKSQFGQTLTVPQEEDRNSELSPLSDGVESLATSTADTGDELVSGTAVTEDRSEVSKMPSERSSSPSSASGSQSGLSKPPPVLPKSEKALLKAMKLTTRRIKKEEGQSKLSHKSSHSSRKHRTVKHSTDNPENIQTEDKTSISSRRHVEKLSQSGEKEHRHKKEERCHPNEGSHNQRHATQTKTEQAQCPQRDQSSERWDRSRVDRSGYTTGKQVQNRTESIDRSGEILPDVILTEREGRSSDHHHHPRDKPEHRNYSSDRVISNVPVYKAHVSEARPAAADRQVKRSQSMDTHAGDPLERRASADMSVNSGQEKAESRNQRIEKSIMEELQQRGRAKDRPGRGGGGGDAVLKRSHSIDTYASEASHPSNLSRQSSYSGQQQLSRQSSVEHTIVTQSIPMTQRKLLQDPDSGQYFFVDMPVQVKTKTFYDPETGNYVQLPVQPPEGAIPQASTVEVLNTPMVLYHGFVPVPITSIAHNSVVQASQMEQEEFERRQQKERSRQAYSSEGCPYLEPVYGQHDHMLGEFLGVEELDCAS